MPLFERPEFSPDFGYEVRSGPSCFVSRHRPTVAIMATIDGGITLDVAQEQLGLAIAALAAARQQQSFAVTSPSGGRSGARALLGCLHNDEKLWRQEVAASSAAHAVRFFV